RHRPADARTRPDDGRQHRHAADRLVGAHHSRPRRARARRRLRPHGRLRRWKELPMTALLDVRDINVTIARTKVLTDVSLALDSGEALGIIGETGSGKTMTLRAVTGLLSSIGGRIESGAVHVDGRDVTRESLRSRQRTLRGIVSMVPQASMSSLDPLQR